MRANAIVGMIKGNGYTCQYFWIRIRKALKKEMFGWIKK